MFNELVKAGIVNSASYSAFIKKAMRRILIARAQAKTLTSAEVLAPGPEEAAPAAVSIPAAALQVEASLIEVASVVVASKEIEMPTSEVC